MSHRWTAPLLPLLLCAVAAMGTAAAVTGVGVGFGIGDPIPPHPRLIATPEKVARLQDVIKLDPEAAYHVGELAAQGTAMLSEPPVVQPPPGPSGILTTVRAVVGRVMTLGLLHMLRWNDSNDDNTTHTEDSNNANATAWSTRAILELHAFANFTTWNPPHFLDTAEGTFAMAVGLDWLDDALSDVDRAYFQDTLVRLGLNEGAKAFNNTGVCHWWTTSPSNWNQVQLAS